MAYEAERAMQEYLKRYSAEEIMLSRRSVSLTPHEEQAIVDEARRDAHKSDDSYHADSCPWFLSRHKRNCQCDAFATERDDLRRVAMNAKAVERLDAQKDAVR